MASDGTKNCPVAGTSKRPAKPARARVLMSGALGATHREKTSSAARKA